ncbi:hypothetical protein B0H19DRAFT_1077910 [Mycena capillaripes]|nr:hypothetical protein B0H19DRAFT_1077910 [Mycena capillaripes]
MSVRKDRYYTIGIHRAPAHHSKKEFDTRISGLADALSAVPVVQKNYLKFDVITQTNILDGHGTALANPQPTALCLAECETEEHTIEVIYNGRAVLADPTVRKLVVEAEEFGFQTNGIAFGADVITKVERATSGTGVHATGIFRAPQDVSLTQFLVSFEAMTTKFLALPSVQKNLDKFTMSKLGLSGAAVTVITFSEAETWDRIIEVVQDPDVQKLIADSIKEFSLHPDSCIFSSEIVSKIGGTYGVPEQIHGLIQRPLSRWDIHSTFNDTHVREVRIPVARKDSQRDARN